jgi:adenine-specific DNA methylase
MRLIGDFAAKAVSDKDLKDHCSHDSWIRWQALAKKRSDLDPASLAHRNILRFALLDFIADFADWNAATVPEYLETARALTRSAHEALGGASGSRPMVVDPFAGGGSIPMEALRVGADAFASDLNPIPILLNKVILEYIPRYGQRLRDEVRKWGDQIAREAETRLEDFYPKDSGGERPIAYLWARTITCEGPGCGTEVPLLRTLWLAKKATHSVALQLLPNRTLKRVDFQIIVKENGGWIKQDQRGISIPNPQFEGTVKRGSATCPCCGYTTPVTKIREQLTRKGGGAQDARLLSVVTVNTNRTGRMYRLATDRDLEIVELARAELNDLSRRNEGPLSLVPDEKVPLTELRRISVPLYGMNNWGSFFSPRPALALSFYASAVSRIEKLSDPEDPDLRRAVKICLAFAVSKQADFNSSLSRWANHMEKSVATFSRQALGMLWDWGEVCPLGASTGSFSVALSWVINALDQQWLDHGGQVTRASATSPILPDESAHVLFTDPPYYDAIPYSHLSDFFYVWLKRCLWSEFPDLVSTEVTPKNEEIVVDRPHSRSGSTKTATYYEHELTRAFANAKNITAPNGVGVIVFASKTTASWEAVLGAIIEGGWIITGSWPIDTEKADRMNAIGTASLASSVHIVCRPRERSDGTFRLNDVGDWRDVLMELPRRIHDWMPRLAQEGVVGADAIFSCLGPALEIFSRFSRVEKPNGDEVKLKEYLEYVWAAVSKEAISMIFAGADTTGFEEDARLTAMWLWTISSRLSESEGPEPDEAEDGDAESDELPAPGGKLAGFAIEYDAARKIAQGLGAHLELLANVVEIKGETARLLPVAERTKALFGKEGTESPSAKKKKSAQLSLPGLLEELEQEDSGWTLQNAAKPGSTTLDRLHQAMILFAAGRGEALRRFLVDDGVGKDQTFWSLAQSLCALYPSGTDERRWSEGVLARKKGLGL